jgi:UDP-N-acetylglucosamine:LPS N-acetylglucosamine transferase/predicted metal-dependent phosphoesterase TrpH
MKTVLVLTAGFGDVHLTAARNVAEALESTSSDVRVEVLDLFKTDAGLLRLAARKAYRGLVQLAPALWGGLTSLWDGSESTDAQHAVSGEFQSALGNLLQDTQPDVVVSTHPTYAGAISNLYREHAERPFRLVTIITESIVRDPGWLRGFSDLYCVPNDTAAEALRSRGIPEDRIRCFGFPVSPPLGGQRPAPLCEPAKHGPCRLLYMVGSGKKKAGKGLKRLLEREEYELTIAVGRNAYLKEKLTKQLKGYGERVQVLGWTNNVSALLAKHHLLVGQPGPVMVQEAIAAGCPVVASQGGSGLEADSPWITDQDIGTVVAKGRQLADWIHHAFKRDARVWRRWRANLARISRPDASARIAKAILSECDCSNRDSEAFPDLAVRNWMPENSPRTKPTGVAAHPGPLLCDFHIHSNYSDGKLSVSEVVDFYGRRQFDCICITDHLADSRRVIGKLGKLSRLTLSPSQLPEYFEIIERERRRAWRKYGMLVMAGLEFNKDGLTSKSSAHLLGIDLEMPIIDCLDLPETIFEIHSQKGLAVASHPHIMKSEWGKNTLYLWEHQERFAPLLDAWEIANRNNMFNPVSAKRLPYLANSDFHKPKHIYSWKTLVSSEKSPEAIKECIRKNERIAITLYRENETSTRSVPSLLAMTAEATNASRAQPLIPAA